MLDAIDIERGLFPWSRQEENKTSSNVWSDRIKMLSISNDLKKKAHFYFNISDDDIKAKNCMSFYEIEEYEILQIMNDKFGLKPHELEEYDANWVQKMVTIISEDNKAQSAKMKQSTAN